MQKKNNYLLLSIILLSITQVAMIPLTIWFDWRWYWFLSPTFTIWALILITAFVDIVFIQPKTRHLKTHQCPGCGAIWCTEEMQWQACNNCGYPYYDEDDETINELINSNEKPEISPFIQPLMHE